MSAIKFDVAMEKSLEILQALNEAREGTTIAQAQVFLTLVALTEGRDDRHVAQADIGERLGRPQGVISKQLDKFVDAKLLTIEPTRAVNYYPLTKTGLALCHRIRKIIER